MAGMCCLLAASISSCVKDDWVNPNGDKALNVTIHVAGVNDQVITRADEYSPRTDKSMIRRLDILLANRGNITKVVNLDENATLIDAADLDATGLKAGSFPTQENTFNPGITFRIGLSDMEGVTDIYLVANYISPTTHNLAPITWSTVPTVAALNELKQGYATGVEAGSVCTMYGHISMLDQPDSSTDEINSYSVSLKRTMAMITLAIDGTNLANGVVITPISAKLVKIPSSCTVTGIIPNAPATKDEIIPEGNSIISLNNLWGPVCNAATAALNKEGQEVVPRAWTTDKFIDPNGPHGTNDMDGKVLPLFMFENKQGTNEPKENTTFPGKPEIGKTPVEGKEDVCSYIEVLASYRYSTSLGGTNTSMGNKSGNITYRFYLGNNTTNDFNVERNKHYMLTLQLRNYGGLEEYGNIDSNGIWVANPDKGEASWRVEPVFSTGGISEDELEVPAAGACVEVLLDTWYAGIGNNVHITYTEKGQSNTVWLKLKEPNNGATWVKNPSTAKLVEHMLPNGDGTYTLRIYVMPLGQDAFDNLASTLTTLEDWTANGKKVHEFEITGGTAQQNVSFKINQWLPMPVMDPADVGTSTDPNDAKLYFSRFDLDHGTAFPWCHKGMYDFNMWTGALVTDADKLNIYQSWDAIGTPQTYDRTIGFHKTVAYYQTNAEKTMLGEIDFKDGSPETVMAYAFFTAANAEQIGKDAMFVQNAADAKIFTHYGLPSVEEWEKIEKYGKYDNRYPLMTGMQYWTSTINGDPASEGQPATGGDKTMVYMLGTGKAGAMAKDRYLEYPARLVYTKRAKATPTGATTTR